MMVTVAWILAAVALVIGVYYLIPNVYHVLTLAGEDPMASHYKHAIAFFAVAIVLFLGGRFMRNSQTTA